MSLEKSALISALAILVSMSLFMPYVRAEIELSSDFVEPIKNSSFEDRDENIPGDGVYRCPPWATNNGGWRELRGDVDGDGDVDFDDFTIFSGKYGSQYGDPVYDWRCDFDGDGDVDFDDFTILSGNYGKTATRLDGTHSWFTDGEGVYQMWQVLDSDTQNLIRRKTVTFAFYFRPESVAPDGEENMARAGIKYQRRLNSRLVWGEYWSEWVKPTNDTTWSYAFVTGEIHPTASSIRVMIEGKHNNEGTGEFKAWIDLASLAITETSVLEYPSLPMDPCKLSLTTAVYEVNASHQSSEPRGMALLAVSASVDAPYPYLVFEIAIRIRLIEGVSAEITSVTQSNDIGWVTDPDQSEQIKYWHNFAGAVCMRFISAAVMWHVPTGTPGTLEELMVDVISDAGGDLIMMTMGSWRGVDIQVPYTDEGGYARVFIHYAPFFEPVTVRFANERCLVELPFNSAEGCQVEVTAETNIWSTWGDDYGFYETSTLVTVSP